jgi:hypothetical protein
VHRHADDGRDADEYAVPHADRDAAGGPAAPTDLRAQPIGAAGSQRIDLNWTNNATGAGIAIERATAPDLATNLTTFEVPATSTSYTDTGVGPRTTFFSRVFAVGALQRRVRHHDVAGECPPPPSTDGSPARNVRRRAWYRHRLRPISPRPGVTLFGHGSTPARPNRTG